jgi:hypothetical protein
MEKNTISTDGRLAVKVQERITKMCKLHTRAEEAARTKRSYPEKEEPPMPFLYQG